MKYNSPKTVLTKFVELIGMSVSHKNSLFVSISTFQTFSFQDLEFTTIVKNETELEDLKVGKFDFLIGDLPFGMRPEEVDTISKLRVNQNWKFLLKSLRLLSDNGNALFLCEPSLLFSQIGKKFLSDLEHEGYYLSGVFNPPPKLFYPETAFTPVLISFDRNTKTKIFIAELEEDNIDSLVANFIEKSASNNLGEGVLIEKGEFNSFDKYKIESQIDNLKTQYKEYTRYTLADISKEINLTRTEFIDKPNTIYIPSIGTSPVVSSINETTLKHQNYFQVVLDESIVSSNFLELFYRSDLGKLILSSITSGAFIPKINKSDIQTSYVALPNLEEQTLLVYTKNKLSELQKTILQLEKELSLNPKNATAILDKFDEIQKPLKTLSEEDRILDLIRRGENKTIEFKQTFSKNIKTNQDDKEIKKSSLKNIVGFLNTEGGSLLIGVSDEGHVVGIEEDFYKTNDKYLLNFKNALNSKIGAEFYPLIDYDIHTVLGKKVLLVECKPSSEPCFYEDVEFFVRTNPATDKLEGKKQNEYIKKRFK